MTAGCIIRDTAGCGTQLHRLGASSATAEVQIRLSQFAACTRRERLGDKSLRLPGSGHSRLLLVQRLSALCQQYITGSGRGIDVCPGGVRLEIGLSSIGEATRCRSRSGCWCGLSGEGLIAAISGAAAVSRDNAEVVERVCAQATNVRANTLIRCSGESRLVRGGRAIGYGCAVVEVYSRAVSIGIYCTV